MVDHMQDAAAGLPDEPDGNPPDDLREITLDADAVPVCLKCLTPHSSLDHYCKHCGYAVGTFTRYIPFVNIPWQVDFWSRLANVARDRNRRRLMRAAACLLVVALAPIMLLGILFGTKPDIVRDETPPTE